MSKFKVGDKARCTKNYSDQFTAGKIYTVADYNSSYLDVIEDDNGNPNGYGIAYFELVEEESSGQALGNAIRNLIDSGSVVSMKKVSISTDEYEVVITKTEK